MLVGFVQPYTRAVIEARSAEKWANSLTPERTPSVQDFGVESNPKCANPGALDRAADLRFGGSVLTTGPFCRDLLVALLSDIWNSDGSAEGLSDLRSRAFGLWEWDRKGGVRILFVCQRAAGVHR